MEKFKFEPGTKVKHEKVNGAGKVLEQVDTELTAVQWYTKEEGFYKTLFNTENLVSCETKRFSKSKIKKKAKQLT